MRSFLFTLRNSVAESNLSFLVRLSACCVQWVQGSSYPTTPLHSKLTASHTGQWTFAITRRRVAQHRPGKCHTLESVSLVFIQSSRRALFCYLRVRKNGFLIDWAQGHCAVRTCGQQFGPPACKSLSLSLGRWAVPYCAAIGLSIKAPTLRGSTGWLHSFPNDPNVI